MCPERFTFGSENCSCLGCSRQRGAGLPFALFILVVLSFIAVAIAFLSEDSGQRFGLEINSMRAFYAAESGAQIAVHRRVPPSGSPTACASNMLNLSFTTSGLAGCSVSVDCVSSSLGSQTYSTLTSTGVCGSLNDEARRIVQVRIK